MKKFTHLHVHTQYSLLDGTIKVDQLASRVKELGMNACAITDHGNMHGVIEFYKACKEEGIKPIIGCEAYITFDEDGLEKSEMTRDNYHMVLLAMNKTGFSNLLWLVSNANLRNFYYNPRICWNNLLERNEGLIATTSCLAGITAKTVRFKDNGDFKILGGAYDPDTKSFLDYYNVLKARLYTLKEAFKDRFFIEIQDHDFWEQRAYNLWAQRMAWDMNIPLVATCDAHYLTKSDHKAHSLILAQQMKTTLENYQASGELKYDDRSFIRSPEEMWQVTEMWGAPEAAENTTMIAERCDLDIQLGVYQTPIFDITKCDDYSNFVRWKNERKSQNRSTDQK